MGDIRRFYSSNAINAFIEIDLIHYESGNYTAGKHIRKRANAYARKILFKAILNIISASKTIPTNIRLVYKRKRQSSGSKGTKKIVISAIHHLIRTIYHLVLNNEMYDTKMFLGEH
ncbi:transposase [Companilactobacillus halodurans]|uniref:transposase n=1 Tax=Companilactobacillus halodurans TaxID=2584183 RepID=UPI001EE1BD40|nr:transposase [Companilactobacillus halodurans]